MYAAKYGLSGAVWLLLTRDDVLPGALDQDRRTLLSYAARYGHEDIVGALMARRDIQPHLIDGAGRSPLSHAAEGGWEAIVRLLLASGKFEPDSQDLSGERPISYALRGEHAGVVEILIKTDRVNVFQRVNGKDLLSWAVRTGNQAIATLLLEKGVDLGRASELDRRTPLALAAAAGNVPLASLLIAAGANIEAADRSGWRPLHLAVMEQITEIVGLLLNRGASSECTAGEYHSTPLILAAERGDVATVKVLLETDTNIEAQDSDGKRPLILAIMNHHKAVVELLLERGAQVNICCDSGRYTPLLIAASHGHLELVKLLLERGAKHEPDGDCDAPLLAHVALQQAMGANQEKRDKYGAILKLLVESGIVYCRGDVGRATSLYPSVRGSVEGILRAAGVANVEEANETRKKRRWKWIAGRQIESRQKGKAQALPHSAR